jgi:Leucine-rich repeat (LRR) protein
MVKNANRILFLILLCIVDIVTMAQSESPESRYESIRSRLDSNDIVKMSQQERAKVKSIVLKYWGRKKVIGNYQGMELYSMYFRGFPKQLKGFPELKWLKIQSFPIYKTDFGFSELSKLEYLYLLSDSLNTFPVGIKGSKSLIKVDFSGNDFEEIPSWLFEIQSLKEVVISNQIKNQKFLKLPLLSKNADSLIKLDLSKSKIYDLNSGFLKFPNLVHLDVSNTYISDLPENLSKLSKLNYLDISNTRLKELPKEVYKLNLEHLNISGCNLINELSERIILLNNLRVLDLRNTDIKKLPEELWSLPKLQLLYLPNNKEFKRWYLGNKERIDKINKNGQLQIFGTND